LGSRFTAKEVDKGEGWNDKCEECDRGGKDILCCQFCQRVQHSYCLGKERQHGSTDDEWLCSECQVQKDMSNHDMSCDSCNDRVWLLEDMRHALNVIEGVASERGMTDRVASALALATAPTAAAPPVVLTTQVATEVVENAAKLVCIHGSAVDCACDACILRKARLDLDGVESSLLKLVSHKIRTMDLGQYKSWVLEHLEEHQGFDLSDYWAKRKRRKAQQGTCEGNQSGLSVHGMCIVYLKPSAAVRAKYPEHDFTMYDKLGADDKFVTHNFHLVAGDAKQTVFHTLSGWEAAYKQLKLMCPWLTEMYKQNDNASNYHSVLTLITVRRLNEPGEGKDEGDSDGGLNMAALNRDLDEGFDQELASEVADGLERQRISGAENFVLELNRHNDIAMQPDASGNEFVPSKHKIGSIKLLSHYRDWEFKADGSVVLRERFDLLHATLGVQFTSAELDALFNGKVQGATGATLIAPTATAEQPKQAKGRQTKEVKNAKESKKQEVKALRGTKKAAAARAVVESGVAVAAQAKQGLKLACAFQCAVPSELLSCI
jgi:hypothetical protein